MPAGLKLKGTLPHGDANGLAAAAQAFIDRPGDMKIVVAILDTKTTEVDNDTGDSTAVARLRRVEVITDKDDGQMLTRLLVRAFERRTGHVALPLDLEDALIDVFAGVDPETGELRLPLGNQPPPAPDDDDEQDGDDAST